MDLILTKEMVEEQEKMFQLKHFDNRDAIELGQTILNLAKERKVPIAIDITKCKQQVFHAALPGSSHDNDLWLKRKVRTVYHYGKSSMLIQIAVKERQSTIDQMSHISAHKYAAAGGAFPIFVKGTGLVGVAAASGMSSEEDHMLIVDALEIFAKKNL